MKIRSRLLTRLAAALGAALVRLLFWTCKVEIHADVAGASPYDGTGSKRYLYCVWHDQLIMTIFSGRPQEMAGLVSQHQDGSYLADAMEMVGITPVRGSSKRGGARAMRELIERTRDLHVAITPDGPRGPRHKIKPGLLFLASHSGKAIIPTAYTCRRCWKLQGSWTDMMIPKPFTRVYVRGGKLFEVPHRLKREGLKHYTALLEAEMQRLETEAEALARGQQIAAPALKDAA